MIVDAHSHGLHGGYLEQLAEAGRSWGRKTVDHMRQLSLKIPHLLDVGLRVDDLERFGADLQVVTPPLGCDAALSSGDIAVQLAVARVINDNMARLQEDSKGRLVGIGNVPIGAMEQGGRQELERAITSLGLRGVNVFTTINGKPLDLSEYEPFWTCASEMNVTVYTHPLEQPGRPYEMIYDVPHTFGWPYETTVMLARLVFSGVMERHPNLKIVAHHLGGGMIPFFMERIIDSNDPNGVAPYKDTTLSRPLFDYFSRFYYDTAGGCGGPGIKCAYEVFGANQLIFATDNPYGPGGAGGRLESDPKVIRSLGFPAADTEKILSGNARRILALD